MESASPPRRWRKRLTVRPSVRAMMILVLALGGGLGWVVHLARVQRDAVAAIQDAGGKVVYDWGWVDGYSAPPGDAIRWPRWLVALGPDYFIHPLTVSFVDGPANQTDDALMGYVGQLERLEHLNLHGSKSVTDAGLARLRGLTSLRDLDLGSTAMTGAGLRHVAGMTRLRNLSLPDGPITDADLAHLKGLTGLVEIVVQEPSPGVTDAGVGHLKALVNLQRLRFVSSRITSHGLASLHDMASLEILKLPGSGVRDLAPIRHLIGLRLLDLSFAPLDDAGLAPIAALKRMDILILEGTKVTDAGLTHLRGLERLDCLRLGRTGVSDSGLISIGGLPRLDRLSLDHTSVGDEGLSHLAGLEKLRLLDLGGTRITDAGLGHLAGLKRCELVTIGETAVTDAGIKAAQQKRPKTSFIR